MKHHLTALVSLIISTNAFANLSDTTMVDSTSVHIQSLRAFKSYNSEDTWFTTGYANVLSTINGRVGIVGTGSYLSDIQVNNYSYRMQPQTLQVLNGVPLNIFRNSLLTSSEDQMSQTYYLSPWEVDQLSVEKGTSNVAGYGHLGTNGMINMSQSLNINDGFNVSFMSGFTQQKHKVGDYQSNIYRNGLQLTYGKEKFKNILSTEYLKTGADTDLSGYNISYNGTYQPTETLELSLYLNNFENETNIKSKRRMGHLGVIWSPLGDFQFAAGLSGLQRNVVRSFDTSTNIEIDRMQWQYYLSAIYNTQLSDDWGVSAETGIRNSSFVEETMSNSGVLTSQLRLEQDLNNFYFRSAIDYKQSAFFGYAYDKEKSTIQPTPDDTNNYHLLFGGLDFGRMIKSGLINQSLLRVNHQFGVANNHQTEVGAELGLLKNRYQLSITYFDIQRTDAISIPTNTIIGVVPVPYDISTVSDGVEIEFNAKPLHFWNVNLSWSNPETNIVDNNADPDFEFDFVDSDDVIIGEGLDGLFDGLSGNVFSYSPFADWTATMYNDFQIKNVNVGFLCSYQKGGDVLMPAFPGDGTFGSFDTEDASSFAVRNIYVRYQFTNISFARKISLGFSGQNLLTKSNLADNQLPEYFTLANQSSVNQSFGFDVRIDF